MKTQTKGFGTLLIKTKTVDYYGCSITCGKANGNKPMFKLSDLNKHCHQAANRRYEDVMVRACLDQHGQTAFYTDAPGITQALFLLTKEGNTPASRLQSKILQESIKSNIDHQSQMLSIPGTNNIKLKMIDGMLRVGDVAALIGLSEEEMIAEMQSPEFKEYARKAGVSHLM